MYSYNVIIYVLIFTSHSFAEETRCIRVNKNTGVSRCCADYRNISGLCEPCYGSYGIDCTHLCLEGYYGHGCKKICSCAPDQRCHRVHGCMDETKCINNYTEKIECCTDYYRTNSDSCKPCIGYFGQNCSTPCNFGYYGHGCRETCNYSSATHWCDTKSGCMKKNILEDVNNDAFAYNNALGRFQLAFTAVGSIGLTSAVWIILGLICKWYRSRDVIGKINRKVEEHEHVGYSSIESIEPESQTTTATCKFNRMERSTMPTKTLHSAKLQQNSRNKLRRSQSLFDGNRRFERYSDDYNHLDFQKKSTLPPRLVTNHNYSKLNIMASHRCKITNHEELEDNSYVSLVLDETLMASGSDLMKTRQKDMDKKTQLSSIKKDRGVRSNEDQTNTDLPAYCNVDETCSNTSNSLSNIKCDSLNFVDGDMDLNKKYD